MPLLLAGCKWAGFWTMMTMATTFCLPYATAASLCSQGGNGCHVTKCHHPACEPLLVVGMEVLMMVEWGMSNDDMNMNDWDGEWWG